MRILLVTSVHQFCNADVLHVSALRYMGENMKSVHVNISQFTTHTDPET